MREFACLLLIAICSSNIFATFLGSVFVFDNHLLKRTETTSFHSFKFLCSTMQQQTSLFIPVASGNKSGSYLAEGWLSKREERFR